MRFVVTTDSGIIDNPADNTGKIIVTEDSQKLYVDQNGKRIPVSDIIKTTSTDLPETGVLGKMYYCTDTKAFVSWDGSKYTSANDHPSIAVSVDTTSAVTPGEGGKFTAIDSVTRDVNGHVTKVNTKSITLPSHTAVSTTTTTSDPSTLEYGSSFKTVTGIERDKNGHVTGYTLKQFTLPALSHSTITKSADTAPTASIAYGGTFSAVTGVTRDTNGHVTSIALSKFTIPSLSHIVVAVKDGTSSSSTLASGGKFSVITGVTRDTYGHITGFTSATYTLPSSNNYTHPTYNRSNTTSTASLTYGANVSVIDSIESSNGHITKVNTKTITLPALSHIGITPGKSTTVDSTIEYSAESPLITIPVPNYVFDSYGHKTAVTTVNYQIPQMRQAGVTSEQTLGFGQSFTAIDGVSFNIRSVDASGTVLPTLTVNKCTYTLPKTHMEILMGKDNTIRKTLSYGENFSFIGIGSTDSYGHVISKQSYSLTLPKAYTHPKFSFTEPTEMTTSTSCSGGDNILVPYDFNVVNGHLSGFKLKAYTLPQTGHEGLVGVAPESTTTPVSYNSSSNAYSFTESYPKLNGWHVVGTVNNAITLKMPDWFKSFGYNPYAPIRLGITESVSISPSSQLAIGDSYALSIDTPDKTSGHTIKTGNIIINNHDSNNNYHMAIAIPNKLVALYATDQDNTTEVRIENARDYLIMRDDANKYGNNADFYGGIYMDNYKINDNDKSYGSQTGFTWHWGRGSKEGYFRPLTNAAYDLGGGSYKWRNIYASNTTIQTSDKNQKNSIDYDISQKSIDIINQLKPCTYKMNDGTSDRTHWGFIAQDVEETVNELGIDDKDFAAICKSRKTKWGTYEVEYTDENGDVCIGEKEGNIPIPEGEEGYGYEYGLRYDELLAPMVAHQQDLAKRVDALEQENAELKQMLNNVLTRLSELESK